MCSGASVGCSTMMWEDLGSIPTQDGIFSYALISLISDNGLQSLFLQHYCYF